jgi:hypothetical protein
MRRRYHLGKRRRRRGLGALDEIRRDDDGDAEPGPGIVAGAREGGQQEEEEGGDDEDVGDLGVADSAERERGVHAGVGAAAEQVAIVHAEDKRGETEALAEPLEQAVEH